MEPNTLIRLPDGRVGRTVSHGPEGYGIKLGDHRWDEDDLPEPDALLRKPWRDDHELEMVGDDYKRVDEGSPNGHS